MKKSLLSFLMLMLCIALLPQGTIAQDLPGGSSGGYLDPTAPDGGVTTPVFPPVAPGYIKSVKRNNGNATSIGGTAEARLQISKTYAGDITLIDVSYLDRPSVSLNAVLNGWGFRESGYFSYALKKNVNPAKKLMFYFACSDGTRFCIPETN